MQADVRVCWVLVSWNITRTRYDAGRARRRIQFFNKSPNHSREPGKVQPIYGTYKATRTKGGKRYTRKPEQSQNQKSRVGPTIELRQCFTKFTNEWKSCMNPHPISTQATLSAGVSRPCFSEPGDHGRWSSVSVMQKGLQRVWQLSRVTHVDMQGFITGLQKQTNGEGEKIPFLEPNDLSVWKKKRALEDKLLKYNWI